MKKAGYPAFDVHVTLHVELMRKTRAIAREASLTKDPETVFKFLKEWWLGHINGEDRKYAPQVKNFLEI
jgi:hemerythrin